MTDETEATVLVDKATASLKAGQLETASSQARAALELEADNSDALYLLAVCERYLRKPDAAVEVIERLKVLRPDYGRAYQEAGHIYRMKKDAVAAQAAYERAVQLNPALGASWQALQQLAVQSGNEVLQATARYQLERLAALPKELVSVTSFIHEGRLYKAEKLCRLFLRGNPHHVEAMRLLADIGVRLQVLDDAEFLLESCVEFAPDYEAARLDYVNVLHKRQKFEQAYVEAKNLKEKVPDNLAYEVLYANECVATGRFDDALAIYDKAAGAVQDNATIHLAKGHALKTVGQQAGAIEAYRHAYQAQADLGDAYWSLANLKTYRFTDEEVMAMQAEEARAGIAAADRYHLCFALGKAFEDRADFKTSFDYYTCGNALKKAELRYSADAMEEELQAQAEVCNAALFNEKAGMGAASDAPIFIVGLPRAGSTLVEQILASHSQVDGTMELPNIMALAHRLGGRRRKGEAAKYPAVLHDLSADQLQELGECYLRETEFCRSGAPYFTDKMPNNFRHIGLVSLILPNARIIDARRDGMACCFSGFKQLFAEGQEFTYGIEEVGRYYRDYTALMAHWDKVLPGKVLRVQYEDTVADLEAQVRRILDFCGLEFEEACVNFHKTERSVRTASSEQVRQPINKKGLAQWRHFENELRPLADILGYKI
ncbi:tetratricopeptide repeat-containing sulfotransferase family protein [Kordiimonas aestuarii]|uniref:tetratricopeptide repeat-containing sulfotransferase family protein n=1 Tax=Kordiimonas aestuarii TaxID=1005925 RepID=UPI0021D18107|nr:tetratricopeptide repeat-containing sulfotransferase family protein [Kordiimonas aestuarii]